MKDLDPNTKGGLVAVVTAFIVFLLLMAISSGEGAISIVIGAIMILAVVLIWVMNLRTKITASGEQAEQVESFADAPISHSTGQPQPPATQRIKALFGMTDMDQIEGSIKAIYTELCKLRANNVICSPDLSTKVQEQEEIMKTLTSERDKAQAASQEWEAKTISSEKEVEQLKKEMEEHGKWEAVDEEQLATFFPTVNLGDGEDPFLASSRRQRRLMQRLSAEGYSIVRKTN